MDGNPDPFRVTPEAIRAARKGARLTLAAFAKILHVAPGTPGRWERGESTPRGLQLRSLQAAMEVLRKARRANERINRAVNQ